MAETLPTSVAMTASARRTTFSEIVEPLRTMSVRGLSRMYNPRERLFVFRLRRTPEGVVQEGLSLRYTAITLMGLGSLPDSMVSTVLGPHSCEDVCRRMLDDAARSTNLGDVALSVLAADAVGYGDVGLAGRRLAALEPLDAPHPVVEIAWAVAALSDVPSADVGQLRDRLASRLMSLFHPGSKLFPHVGDARSLRSHVACFADIIYPIQALAKYASADRQSRRSTCRRCALLTCAVSRARRVSGGGTTTFEPATCSNGIPAYAIHQDAMGPMGLLRSRRSRRPDCQPPSTGACSGCLPLPS